MQLNLVWVLNKKTGRTTYHAVNDKHYDAMLAGGGSSLDDKYAWGCLGDVTISEEILNEEGYKQCDCCSTRDTLCQQGCY